MATDYVLLNERLDRLIDASLPAVTNFANASALLYFSLECVNWAGFYFIEGSVLVLGPFQGLPACVKIPLGKGVCGTAAAQNKTLTVDDVHTFEGHIACDSASNSEIVIPLVKGGELFGVLDVDSPVKGRFSCDDRKGLERFVSILCAKVSKTGLFI